MAYGEMTFTWKRISRVSDGAAGKIETLTTLGTPTGRKHFYQRASQQQLERSEEPARAVRTQEFVAFDDPALDIRQHDLLFEGTVADSPSAEAAAVRWNVNHVRHYDFQTQADVERVA